MSPIISLQISNELLEKFENIRKISGFDSKSQALRESIVNFIENYEKYENLEDYKIITITLTYPFREIIINEITEIFSQFSNIIKTATDWRIADKKIEIIVVVSKLSLIKELKNKLSNIKDVLCSMHKVIID
ncbi:MAG: hypothetical protein JXA99_13790 [Candidatus Lokiarchaeota archaeon]|nr:hypothetical protein [Candidatus Lokiarchaeota archaeon]